MRILGDEVDVGDVHGVDAAVLAAEGREEDAVDDMSAALEDEDDDTIGS